jgi:hypothetical protein
MGFAIELPLTVAAKVPLFASENENVAVPTALL